MEPKRYRPWWKKKRWWAALVLWLPLPVLYVLAGGPAWYAFNRGWLPKGAAEVLILHYRYQRLLPGPLSDAYDGYLKWWGLLCIQHMAEAGEFTSD